MNFPSPGAQYVDERGATIQVLEVRPGDGSGEATVVEVCSVSATGKLIAPRRSIPIEQWPRFAEGMRRVV